ncbi:cache domain-containing sensor histidine kinase [Metabacillus malikii]|uniref:Two-component system sensor histidine kinase YesM n=1 Tax=Metabacillus malikii TaxID=1504265 RepID=A0ABT9ZDN5_9BACI|nr:sensor histidine kinase [Metabacillus malikii]MDQ0229957.1 two-component system sensor histidine kinase YesM [Metabacillus malikii]
MKRFHINNVKLKNKLLIVYILAVFIPVLLTNIIFYQVTTSNVRTQKINDLSLAIEQMANDFRQGIDDAVGVSSFLYTDNLLYSFLEHEYENDIEFILAYNSFFRDINKYTPIYSTIHSISLYTDNDTVIFAGGINKTTNEIKQTNWYKKMNQVNSMYPIVTRTTGEDGSLNTFSVIRELGYSKSNEKEKIIKIDLNMSSIERIFHNVTFQGDVYLINSNGNIEYTTNKNIDWQNEKHSFSENSFPKEMLFITEQFPQQHMNNWKVVGAITEDKLLEDVKSSRKFIIYFALINIILPSLLIILITRNIHHRLSNVLKHMRKLEAQSFEIIEGKEYKDEIGALTSGFNRMSLKIKGLINDVYVASIQKKDLDLQRKQAQLSALQSQINPHFLFNVLETIRMRSLIKEEKETSNIIHNLAKLLRRSFIWGKDWVTVKEELQVINSFLEIQHYRFDEKMTYTFDVDESTLNCLIPNMSLIPFVENASIHGIEPLKADGVIEVKIKRFEDNILCTISDNGVGIDTKKYNEIMQSFHDENFTGEHVGMKNVFYRFKLHYQNQFDLKIISKQGHGTTLQIKLPYQEYK